MLYRKMGKTGDKVSILGYGCLRFPRENGRIDKKRTERQIISAIEQGVNYFDTAYLYQNSEAVLGEILAKGYRDKVYIATKIPPIMAHSLKEMESVLEKELRRLQTDYIDYYLIHCLNSFDGWKRLKQSGIEEFINRAKGSGRIRHMGFSYHGNSKDFKKVVDDYPWEFCLIQYNYLDEDSQAGREGLQYAASRGLGISIMEPLRGGLLAQKVPERVQAIFKRTELKRSPAEWA
ncbi:MAG TPA: aldo/keto reductase, partial [Halanaerobiales bacterium]|nr:aldo/keto reductase [Halanaerobiales bacterium]